MSQDRKSLLTMAEQFSGLPMKDLIGAPLQAAAEANNMMAVTLTNFILDTAFAVHNKGEKNEYLEPVTIEFKLVRGVLREGTEGLEVENFETSIQLPLLTIIPLNALAVDDVSIRFNMEVKSSYGETKSEAQVDKRKTEGNYGAKLGFGWFRAGSSGSVSTSSTRKSNEEMHYQKSNSAEYTVDVHGGQIPLPDGVKTIIDAFTKAIDPIKLPVEKEK